MFHFGLESQEGTHTYVEFEKSGKISLKGGGAKFVKVGAKFFARFDRKFFARFSLFFLFPF